MSSDDPNTRRPVGELGRKLAHLANEIAERRGGSATYLGEGKSAAVFRLDGSNDPEALKIYDPIFFEGSNPELERARIRMQMSLRGHGCHTLVDFIEAGDIRTTAYLIMEYLPWRPLDECLLSLPRDQIRAIVAQVAEAARFLDGQGFCHRDIKTANVMVSPDRFC